MTRAAAEQLARSGRETVLAELDPDDWVTEQLRRAWTGRDPEALAAELAATGRQPAPTLDDLARIKVPVGVVGLRDDPFHPLSVARSWTTALPFASLAVLARSAPARDLAVFADGALGALRSSHPGAARP